ncbi:hypothetical protein MMC34_007260 [Xylographa carneopallida]|nr:hypothetical protein [Xylographa carneopallida]
MSFSTTSQESNIGAVTIICGWVLSGLATIAVSLMIWARRLCLVRLGADDYILITAYIMTIVLVAQTTWAIIDEGQGQHVADVPRTQLALIASSLLAEETLWGIVNTLLRISVLLFTKRLFGVIRHVRYLLNGLIVLSLLLGTPTLAENVAKR